MKSRILVGASILAAATVGAVAPVMADKSNDTLNVVWEKSIPTLDFYFLNLGEGYTVAQNVCDTLVFRDPVSLESQPLLATAWEWTGDTALDLTLREGVTFHDGEAFDADDVVFTLNLMSKPATGALGQVMVDWIDSVEKLEPYKVRIHLKEANKAIFDQIAVGLPIYPSEYYEKVGTKGFGTAPVCTGPYKVTAVEPGTRIALERNESYFAGSPKGTAKIAKIEIRSVQDANTRMAELMTGKADWIYQLSSDMAERLKAVPGIAVIPSESTRIAYLMFNPVNPPEGSPVTNELVRQAIGYAINRDGIVEHLARGKSRRLDTFCHPSMTGCIDGVFTTPYDPEKAKALLAEAGYPDGFTIDLFAYRDRYVSEALIGDLAAVGIIANLNYMQYSSLAENWEQGKLAVAHQTWSGFGMTDAGNHLTSHFLGGDSIAEDPAIKAAIRAGNVAPTQAERDVHYKDALERLARGAYWIPLYTVTDNYAISEALDFKPTLDGIARFYFASWR